MPTIPIGATGVHTLEVDSTNAIDFLGHPDGRVLGTPFMILWMEMTTRNLIKQYLEEGFDSVGTVVNVNHLAATPFGMKVTFKAEVLEVDERRVLCRVEAHDEKEKVGEGLHERFVVNVERFSARVAAKRGR